MYKRQGPSIPNTGLNILSEAVGTFILVFAIKGIGNVTGLSTGVDKLFVFGIIVSVGMSLGGLTGYAINPARDLGPRLAHAVLPIKGKGDSNFSYGLVVPIVGPIIGAIVAVLLYGAIPWPKTTKRGIFYAALYCRVSWNHDAYHPR